MLDYPDEDIEPFEAEECRIALSSAAEELRRILGTFERGRILREGVRAALIGRPNAGKSSLMNALLGYERAIVTNMPGTTRDTIEEKAILGGVTVRLTDTAGLREAEGEAERLGVERARSAAEGAELVIAVFDGSAPLTEEDEETLAAAPRREAGHCRYQQAGSARRALRRGFGRGVQRGGGAELEDARGGGRALRRHSAIVPLPGGPRRARYSQTPVRRRRRGARSARWRRRLTPSPPG